MPLTQTREIAPAQRLENLRYAIRDLVSLADEVKRQGHKVLYLNVGDPNIFDFPYLYIVEPGQWLLSDAEAVRLREYLLRGGFLHADDFWGIHQRANFERVVEVVTSCLESGKPVLLHCLAGINRAPTLAAAVLCRRRGVSVEAALETIQRARPAAYPTPEQEASLRAWLGGRRVLSPEC